MKGDKCMEFLLVLIYFPLISFIFGVISKFFVKNDNLICGFVFIVWFSLTFILLNFSFLMWVFIYTLLTYFGTCISVSIQTFIISKLKK